MRELNLVLPQSPKATYLKLASALREAMRQGQLSPGELLPSTRRLADLVGVHRHTVLSALDELVAEGWVAAEPGRGYRVCDSPELVPAPSWTAPQAEFEWNPLRVQLPTPLQEGLRYAFPSGQPDLRLFPSAEYFGWVRQVLRESRPDELLAYGESAGEGDLREELRVYLRRMRAIMSLDERDQLVVTHGSQEALFLLGKLLLRPGQVAAVEEVGYPPAWEALRASGVRLQGVRVDGEGIDPDDLERVLRSQPVGLIYLTPLHQYPTTVTLSRARRRAVYQLAQRHRVPILEDDYDHEFHYRCEPLPPLKAEDPAGLVLYVSTFSKVLYPAARLGFAVVPRAVAGPLARLKQVVSRQNDTLTQRAVAAWMRDGGFERHLRRMRRIYEKRMLHMLSELEQGAARYGLPLRVDPPDGGMCLWVGLGCDGDRLSEAAAERDVMVRPPRAYRLDPQARGDFLRMGFASAAEDEITAGVERLCQAAAELSSSPSGGMSTRPIRSTR